MARCSIRYWASARAAAGVAEEVLDGATLADVLRAAGELHGERLRSVLDVCSFLLDEQPVGRRDPAQVRLTDDAQIEVLPPFAGG